MINDKNQIALNWQNPFLGDVVSSIKGKKPKSLGKKSQSLSIPYINIKAFETGVVDEYTDGDKCQICGKDDVLMVWDGARSGLVGRGISGAIGSTLVKLETKGLDSSFLFYYLQGKYKYINKNPRGVGIPHVDPNILWKLQIPVPTLAEQKRIVAKIEELFTRLDAGVENLKKTKKLLKNYRQAVLRDAFTGKLTRKVNHKDTKAPRELPDGWEWKPLESISDALGGFAFKSSDYSNNGYQIVKMGNVRMGKLLLGNNPSYIEDVPEDIIHKYLLKKDDIVITLTGTKNKQDYGFVSMIADENKLLLNQRVARLRCYSSVSSKYVMLAMHTKEFRNQFFASETGNVGQGNVGMKSVREVKIPLPELEEQKQIVLEVERHFTIADVVEKEIDEAMKKSDNLRQSILKSAFEGKLVDTEGTHSTSSGQAKHAKSIEYPDAKPERKLMKAAEENMGYGIPGSPEPQLGTEEIQAGAWRSRGKIQAGASQEREWYSRGYLPHRDRISLLQSITFRLADSLPQSKLEQLEEELKDWQENRAGARRSQEEMEISRAGARRSQEEMEISRAGARRSQEEKEFDVERREKIEHWLDSGLGCCALKHPEMADIVQETLLTFDGEKYRLISWAVMPNHVHVLIEPHISLSRIVQSWKSFTGRWALAHSAKLGLGVPGNALWMREYWDRYIRDGKHLASVIEYIHMNPVKAGLCENAKDWKWSSAGIHPKGTPSPSLA